MLLLKRIFAIFIIGTSALYGITTHIAKAQPQKELGQKGKMDQPVLVDIITATKQGTSSYIKALGTARANETVIITAKVSDIVKEILFQEGQVVKQGDILVTLQSQEQNAELKSSEALALEKQKSYERARKLQESKLASKALLDEKQAMLLQAQGALDAAKSKISDRVIRAPFNGVVGLRQVSVGAFLPAGAEITTIDDLTSIKIDMAVPAKYLAKIKTGSAITARTESFPEKEFTGVIQSIDTQIDPSTRSVIIRAIISNADFLLRSGMLMEMSIAHDERQSIILPEGAVIQQGKKSFIYKLDQEKGVAVKTLVELGARRAGDVEILSGIAEGDIIISDGTVNLSDGKKVIIKKAEHTTDATDKQP